MNLKDLEDQLATHDKYAAEFGRVDSFAATLVIARKNPPSGYKILTPFGRCTIMNCKKVDGQYQTCFAVSRKQLVETIRKLKEAL